MDIFSELFNSADYLFSFFYRLIICDYADFVDFFQGNYTFNITSLVNSFEYSVTIPNLPFIDSFIDVIVDVIGQFFYPLPFLTDNLGAEYTPFYNCLISFFIYSLVIVSFLKLISFIIELIPGE